MKREQQQQQLNGAINSVAWNGRFASSSVGAAAASQTTSSNAYLIYLLAVSAIIIVVIANRSRVLSWTWRVEAADDESGGGGGGRSQQLQKKQQQHHYTLLYDESFRTMREAYEGKCESLEVVMMDLQRVVQAERARSVALENEVRVLHLSDNFLRDRLFFLEQHKDSSSLDYLRKYGGATRDASWPTTTSTSTRAAAAPPPDMNPPLSNNNNKNSKTTSWRSAPPPPPPSSSSSSSRTSTSRGGRGLGLSIDDDDDDDYSSQLAAIGVVQDLLRMVVVERERTTDLETEIRTLQRSDSLMQARIQRLEDVAASTTTKNNK